MGQLPFLSTINLSLQTAAFVAWVAGLGIGILLMIRGRERGSELTRDIGIALFIGGFLGLSMNQLEFRESRRHLDEFRTDTERLIQNLRTDIVTTYFGREIPADVSEQIKNNIVLDPFYYLTCDVALTLTNVPLDGSLKMNIDAHFIVKNITKTAQSYPLAVSLSDPHGSKSPGLTRMWVTSNVDPSKSLELNEQQARELLALQTSGQTLVFERTFVMDPGEQLDVTMKTYAYPATRDYYLLALRHPSRRLTLRAEFPDGQYQKWCNFSHPGWNDGAQCVCQNEDAFVKAEINVAVLPYQGIMVEWERNGP